MSYEEIDRDSYGTDVFTNGVEGRYTKPKSTTANSTTEKKRSSKTSTAVADNQNAQSYENGSSDGVVKTKKKTRKVQENGETQNEYESAKADPPINDDETAVKPKKKRAPKVQSNNENIDPLPTTAEAEPVKKKKTKAPKLPTMEEDIQVIDSVPTDDFDQPPIETPVKVKKPKKAKAPKVATESFDDGLINNSNGYANSSEYNDTYPTDGAYGSNLGDGSFDTQGMSYPIDNEQVPLQSEYSDYEVYIRDAYNDLASQVNFSQFLGDDWFIVHLPKSARTEPKSRIRKMLPGGKEEKNDGKPSSGKPPAPKTSLLNRLRSGVNLLVRDEHNLIFGEVSNYDMQYYEEEEDGVDTDDLHRYAQKLRELEDTDREVNPEYLVLRDGKTVYAVQETDAEGKLTLATRKPIYDRFSDQAVDEPMEKKKLLQRLKHPFSRNKDKNANSPKNSNDTPDANARRSSKKSSNKNADDGMATMAASETFMD